ITDIPALRQDPRSPMMVRSSPGSTRRISRRIKIMRKVMSILLALFLCSLPVLSADEKDTKETDRLENAGSVLEEILNIPDNIPQDLIDKAECIVVFPSVMKFAIGI